MLKYIIFSADGIGLPVAKKLIDEGSDVTIAYVNDLDTLETGAKDSDKETRARRLSVYDGILEKLPAEKVIKAMAKIENKDDYFVFFDFNNLWKYAEMALEMGFSKGLYPLKEDWELEQDRNLGKETVKKHYPDLKVAETEEFKSVDDALEFLDGCSDCYVLKANSDDAPTVVPHTSDVDFARKLIVDSLKAHEKEYESKGFILERMIPNVQELTPEILFWGGKPIATSVDLELKNLGDGKVNSVQVGCKTCVVIKTEISDRVNEIAFPKYVYDKAKKRKGLFICDASLLYQPEEDEYYFGEYCGNRFGFDSLFAEIAMAGSATEFFEAIVEGENPFQKTFGATLRGFNMHRHSAEEGGRVLKGVLMQMKEEGEKDTFIYDIQKDEENNTVTVGGSWDTVVFTGSSNDLIYAIEKTFEVKEMFSMEGMYTSSKDDFLSRSYISAILERYDAFNHKLFEQEDIL